MEKRTIYSIAYWIMIIAVISTCIFIYFYLQGNGRECLAEPLKYYEKVMDTSCYCMNDLNPFRIADVNLTTP